MTETETKLGLKQTSRRNRDKTQSNISTETETKPRFSCYLVLNLRRNRESHYSVIHGGLAPGVMVDQRETLAVTTGLTDTVYLKHLFIH